MAFSKLGGHCNEMRHPGQLKSLKSLLTSRGGALDTLHLEARIHDDRATKVQASLPENYRTKVRVGDLEQGLLTLYVPSAEVASKLRFEEQLLLDALQGDRLFQGLRRIQMRVRPTPIAHQHTASTAGRVPDPVAGHHLNEVASKLQDPGLKARFQQLAARVSGNPQPDQSSPTHNSRDPQTGSAAIDYSTRDHSARHDSDQ